MNDTVELPSPLWSLVAWSLWHVTWLGALVWLASWVTLAMFKHASPQLRYSIALFWFCVLACLPVGTFVYKWQCQPDFDLTIVKHRAATLPPALTTNAPQAADLWDPVTSAPAAAEEKPGWALRVRHWTLNTAHALDRASKWLVLLWLSGASLFAIPWNLGFLAVTGLKRQSKPWKNAVGQAVLARLQTEMRVWQRVEVRLASGIRSPILVGILRPMILLPPAIAAGLSVEELEMVLIHELAHVRRLDNAVNLLQRVLESCLVFHPAVWWLSARLRKEREMCCDACVITQTGEAEAYAGLLASLSVSPVFAAPTAMAMSRGYVADRIRYLLHLEERAMSRTQKLLICSMAVALVPGLWALAVAQAPAQDTPETVESRRDFVVTNLGINQTEGNAPTAEEWQLHYKQQKMNGMLGRLYIQDGSQDSVPLLTPQPWRAAIVDLDGAAGEDLVVQDRGGAAYVDLDMDGRVELYFEAPLSSAEGIAGQIAARVLLAKDAAARHHYHADASNLQSCNACHQPVDADVTARRWLALEKAPDTVLGQWAIFDQPQADTVLGHWAVLTQPQADAEGTIGAWERARRRLIKGQLFLQADDRVLLWSASQASSDWSAMQATGAPNTPEAGDHPTAWASKTPDDQDEWLEVTYDNVVDAVAILIFESFNPGALTKVTSVDDSGNETLLWHGIDPMACEKKGVVTIPTAVKTNKVRLYLNSKAAVGWNEIDAVGLIDSSGTTNWATGATASSSYGEDTALHWTAAVNVPVYDFSGDEGQVRLNYIGQGTDTPDLETLRQEVQSLKAQVEKMRELLETLHPRSSDDGAKAAPGDRLEQIELKYELQTSEYRVDPAHVEFLGDALQYHETMLKSDLPMRSVLEYQPTTESAEQTAPADSGTPSKPAAPGDTGGSEGKPLQECPAVSPADEDNPPADAAAT